MTTNDRFEQTLASGLAELGRADATNLIADVLAATARTRQRRAWTGLEGWIAPRGRIVAGGRLGVRWIVVAVLIAIVVAAVAVGVGSRVTPRPTVVSPTIVPPTDASPQILSTEGFPTALAGMWVADQPPRMSFGLPSGPARMTLRLDSSSAFLTDGLPVDWMTADTTATSDVVRFVSTVDTRGASPRKVPTVSVTIDPGTGSQSGTTYPGCTVGDVGTYVWSVNAEQGGTLTLTLLADRCPGRRVIFENRIWQRSRTSNGTGLTTVDAFAPGFTLGLPPKDYAITSTNASWEAEAADGSVRVSAWQDPQLMRNGCDARAGRIEAGPGTENFLAALESRPELTYTLQPGRRIGGHIAEVVRLSSRANDGCPHGAVIGWQPQAETTGRTWSVYDGWSADLVFVDLDGHTVMLEVDVESPPEEPASAILDSIQFQP